MEKMSNALSPLIEKIEQARRSQKEAGLSPTLTSGISSNEGCSICGGSTYTIKTVGEGPERIEYGVPCVCQAQERLQTRIKSARIPEEFTDARFDTYKRDTPNQTKMYDAITGYLKDFQEAKHNGEKLMSFGFLATLGESRLAEMKDSRERIDLKRKHNNFGIGKTHLEMAAAKWLMKQGVDVLAISDEEFMSELWQTALLDDKSIHNDLLEKAMKTTVLIWDDLGKAKMTATRQGYYYRIIDARSRANRPIIFSTNEDMDSLGERIGGAAASRLVGMAKGYLFAVEDADYRMK